MLLIRNVLELLAKSVLIPLGLTVAVSAATDSAIRKKMIGTGCFPSDLAKRTTLIISNLEMNNIMKINKSPEKSGLLIKGVN